MAEAANLTSSLLDKRLLIVTGKGGVGKSAVASALATEAAARGKRVLLASYTRIDEPHPFYGVTMPYEPVAVSDTLFLCRVEAHAALKEYVHRTLPLGGLYDWFLDSKALAHFTEAAPGFDELMCLGKVYDHVEGADAFDLVILDAPSTGHASLMLSVPAVIGRAVGTGPLHHNALKVQLMLESSRTEVVLVALPEEMALREVGELSGQLKGELNMSVGALIINRIAMPLFDASEIQALESLTAGSVGLRRMAAAACERHALVTLQRSYIERVRANDPTLNVPHVIQQKFDGPALARSIADHLTDRTPATGRGP